VLGTDASARRADGAGRRSEGEARRGEAAERRAEVAEAERRAELKRRAEAEAERRAEALRQAQAAEERLAEAERRSDAGETSDEPPPSSGPSLEIEEYSSASEAERLRQRLDGVLDGLSTAARATGERCRKLGGVATRGARWVADHAESAGRRALSGRRATAPRRTAAAPRSSLRASAARMTSRMIQGRGADGAPARKGPPPQLMLGAGLGLLLIVAGAWWGQAAPATPAAASAATRTSSVPAEAAPAAAPAQAATLPPPAALETPAQELPPPSTTPSRILLAPEENEPADVSESRNAVAQAPMFGAGSLGESPRRAAPSRPASEKRMLARATSNAGLFEPAVTPSPRKKSTTEFSSGRLNLPIVHRIRLNQPGTALRGERTPTGFDIIVPGRKTLESGAAIAKRDGRVAKVTTKNGGDGARVSLRFRSGIPAYKARLRDDYLEIFISE
jgi:hypothetical protein